MYMGMTVNLWEAWEPYRAARTALTNTMQSENIASLASKYISKLPVLNKMVSHIYEGSLLLVVKHHTQIRGVAVFNISW